MQGIVFFFCFGCLVWFVGFYGISTFVGYLTPNQFYVNNMFYVKQFTLAEVYSLIVKNISISTIQAVIYNNSVKCKYSFNAEKQFYLK